jgi:hypothetical protein
MDLNEGKITGIRKYFGKPIAIAADYIVLFLLLLICAGNKNAYADTMDSTLVTINTTYNVAVSIDSEYRYLWVGGSSSGNYTPIIMTYVGDDGLISICSIDTDTQTTYIYEYSGDMRHIRTLRITNELRKIGSFAKDNNGNYYIFYAEDVQEGEFSRKNMAVVKYNSAGRKLGSFYLAAQTSDEKWARGYSGVKVPFASGSSRLEISGDWIAVYFARRQFAAPDGLNHQASYGFILDKNRLERIPNIKMPSAGHSFNQYILPIENGFIFADHGDVGPRGFYFNKIQRGQRNRSLQSFSFKQGKVYQNTFSQLGGLAKTSSGYIFAGTYEKNTIVSDDRHNDSRNLFILTFNDSLASAGNPIWITNYANKNTENAANPKIAALGAGRYLLMWECMTSSAYKTTFMRIINENGRPLGEEIELPNVRLNINDVLRYNQATGNVYWAVNHGSREIVIYSLNPYKPIFNATIDESSVLVGRWSLEPGHPTNGNPEELELFKDGSGTIDDIAISWKAENGRFLITDRPASINWNAHAFDYYVSGSDLILIYYGGSLKYKRK